LVRRFESIVKQAVADEMAKIHERLREVDELKSSVEFLAGEFEVLKDTCATTCTSINSLIRENTRLKELNKSLSGQVNSIEQALRSDSLEIHMVPERRGENLASLVGSLCGSININLPPGSITSCRRVGPPSGGKDARPRNVVVSLRDPGLRDEILTQVRAFNRKNASKGRLRTEHLGVGGDPSPVYVQEHLSPFVRGLFAKARRFARESKLKFVWVSRGRVFVKADEASVPVCVSDEGALAGLAGGGVRRLDNKTDPELS
jgi:hypothetical protein